MITMELFEEIYLSGDYEDPHTELAQRLGMTRNEAKNLVYPFLYSYNLGRYGKSWCLQKTLMQTISDALHEYTGTRGYIPDRLFLDDMTYLGDPPHLPDFEYKEDNAIGKKGDRVYKAPKPFWDKSKY